MSAALPAGQLIDVAVRRPKVAPPAAALVHPPAQQLHPGCLQLPHGAGEILDDEADHGTGGEVLVVLVGWAEHLEGAPLRELEGSEVGPLLARGQPEDRSEKPTMAVYSLVLVAAHPMRLTRILASPHVVVAVDRRHVLHDVAPFGAERASHRLGGRPGSATVRRAGGQRLVDFFAVSAAFSVSSRADSPIAVVAPSTLWASSRWAFRSWAAKSNTESTTSAGVGSWPGRCPAAWAVPGTSCWMVSAQVRMPSMTASWLLRRPSSTCAWSSWVRSFSVGMGVLLCRGCTGRLEPASLASYSHTTPQALPAAHPL